MSRYSIRASSASTDNPNTMPPAGVRLIRRSSGPVRGGTSNNSDMPLRPSTSHTSTRRPLVARAEASAPAIVVLPVPPLPLTICRVCRGVTTCL